MKVLIEDKDENFFVEISEMAFFFVLHKFWLHKLSSIPKFFCFVEKIALALTLSLTLPNKMYLSNLLLDSHGLNWVTLSQ